ncbi:MAG: EAL domain-containing protein, partial [Acidimicrobiales bacterium]|nr:EAL domain-containing protein [Acidimicrobiales bacterium]
MSGDLGRHGDRGVLAVGLVVATAAAGVYALLVAPDQQIEAPLDVSAEWLALAFFACELFALRTERHQGESYGFTLALVPLAVGLVYADPGALVASRVVGVAVALALLRQRRVPEAIYEVAVHAAQNIGAIVVYRALLDGAEPVQARGVLALVGGLAMSHLVAAVALAVVVAAASRRLPGRRSVVVIARTGAVAALLNAAIGVGLASALWTHPNLALLVTAIVLASLVCNRVYRGLAHRYKGLETHYEFVSSVVRSTDLREINSSVLAAARKLLRANDAVLLLRSTSEDEPARRLRLGDDGVLQATEVSSAQHVADMRALMPRAVPRRVDLRTESPPWLREIPAIGAMAAPITGTDRSVVGALVVTQAKRKAIASFGDADAVLLGTLADQASIAIENGMLFHRLEREAADRAHQATHDPLTGLPNRSMLTEVLGKALERAYANRTRVGLIVVDLDSFSQVVDAFGHSSSDGLLIQACSRIRGLLPETATLARLSGEQFAIVMPDVDDGEAVIGAARLLIAGFDPPFQTEGVLLALGVNVGIAVYPEQAIDAPSLVQRAHIAADTARRHRSGWELYDAQHDPATPRRLALAADLREALETDGLDVCFQPKVELATGIVRGAEALVRWNHPRLGRVRPDEFITIAEHTGDIRALTMVVMRKALAECSAWRDVGLDLSVAVNLSARNLLDLHLVDDVAAVIDEAGVPPESLTLELTESMVMSESERSVHVLAGLNELGVRLSCDDFGTGYSSLAHLRRLPIVEIKIDKSFIASMTVDESDRAIARSVLALGRDLGLVTVAEGVESREGWDLLTSLGCDMAQGFVVCPPLTSHQFGQWLDRRQPEEFAYLDGGPGPVPAEPEVVEPARPPEPPPPAPASGERPRLVHRRRPATTPGGDGAAAGDGNGDQGVAAARAAGARADGGHDQDASGAGDDATGASGASGSGNGDGSRAGAVSDGPDGDVAADAPDDGDVAAGAPDDG